MNARTPAGRRPPGRRPFALLYLGILLGASATSAHAAAAQTAGTGAAAGIDSLTLARAVETALRSHPSMLGSRARITAAVARVDAARGRLLPGVVAEGSATRFQEPMLVRPLHGFDPQAVPAFDETLIQGRVGVAWTAFDGGARRAAVGEARALEEAARNRAADAEAVLIEEVGDAYLAVVGARRTLEAAGAQVRALESEVARAIRLLEEGAVAEVERLRALAALADAQALESGARARVGGAEERLARLLNVPLERVGTVPLAPVDPALLAVSRGAAPPAVRAAREVATAAAAAAAAERGSRAPTVDVGAGLMTFASAAGDATAEWQAGLRVSWPIFTGGARSAAVRAAEARAAAADADVRLTELSVGQARTAAETAVAEATARRAALATSVERWEEVVRIEGLALEAGAGVQSDYLNAQAALFQARAGLTAAVNQEARARLALARAMGALDREWIVTTREAVP